MTPVHARDYLSPTLVLLALDWADGQTRDDFLGFSIKRSPGFMDLASQQKAPSSWLPNRLGFNGPPAAGKPDFPTNEAPVQKFMWWDARLEGVEESTDVTYDIWAATGTPGHITLEPDSHCTLTIQLPPHVQFNIGTWFNRAVMSSQAFSGMVQTLHLDGGAPSAPQALKLRQWLANGMERPVPDFISSATSLAGAIYHLTDNLWIIPALQSAMANIDAALVYDSHMVAGKKGAPAKPTPNAPAIKLLKKIDFFPRDKTKIMHNKFLVDGKALLAKQDEDQIPERLTCGSANYTTEGLTSQANLLHTFESPDLASEYFERFHLIEDNPPLAATGKVAKWSKTISVGDAGVRVFFSPEHGKPGDDSVSMETIVQSIHEATSSVVFCLFTPTDQMLRDACFSAGDAGKMMFGLVNHIAAHEPTPEPTKKGVIPADQLAALEIYHRSREKRDVIDGAYFNSANLPTGFSLEMNLFPGEKPPPYPPVIIHHKFIVIDAETDSPIIYTGSANMSGNSIFGNDENLLEIKGSPRLARLYLAEFLRLYEHYRARAQYIAMKQSGKAAKAVGFSLVGNRSWATKHYTPGTPEYKARERLLGGD
jgi:phosphatidylserine/phosphatidylglycerophosphate/cardiolipin synthase-like enzyme